MPLERQPQLRERGSLESESERLLFGLVTRERDQRASMSERDPESSAASDELVTMHYGYERVSATKQVECFRNISSDYSLMACAGECLGHSFEKCHIRPYDKYRCHDLF